MRKQIKVIGIGHKEGKSKAGKAYDFYVLHGIYPDDNTDGSATVSVTVPDEFVSTVEIGKEYVLYTHYFNGRECFDVMLPI